MADEEDPTRNIGTRSTPPGEDGGEGPTRNLDWKTRVLDAKERVTGIIERTRQLKVGDITKSINLENLKNLKLGEKLKGMDPAMVSEWAMSTLQGQGVSFYGKAATIVICAYLLAPITAFMVERYIPEPPPVAAFNAGGGMRGPRTIEAYNPIFVRNLFNSKRTTLPFNLVGTVILQDELKSIATIEDKSASLVYPVRATDEIPSKAKILSIEPKRVVFVNLSSNRKEFVDLPDDSAGNPRISVGTKTAASSTPGIEKTSPTSFNIAKTEVDKALGDLNNILTQARAVPNFENGQPAGYKLFQIVPGSIYDKLGLQNGDVIAGFDGQPITDPGKAFEALGNIRNTPHLEIQIKRNGVASTMAYDIH
jgi:type II secretion system protein C